MWERNRQWYMQFVSGGEKKGGISLSVTLTGGEGDNTGEREE